MTVVGASALTVHAFQCVQDAKFDPAWRTESNSLRHRLKLDCQVWKGAVEEALYRLDSSEQSAVELDARREDSDATTEALHSGNFLLCKSEESVEELGSGADLDRMYSTNPIQRPNRLRNAMSDGSLRATGL